MSKEKDYYENDELWNKDAFGEADHKRIEFTYSLLPKNFKSLVDVGCGNGLFLNYIKEKRQKDGVKLLGVDPTAAALKYVTTDKKVGTIENIPLKKGEYEVATAMEIIEHLSVDQFKMSLKELARVAEKYIVISVPYDEELQASFSECLSCHSRFSPYHHKRRFNDETMKSLLNDEGFKLLSLHYSGRVEKLWLLQPIYLFFRKMNPSKAKVANICPVCGFCIAPTGQAGVMAKRNYRKIFRDMIFFPVRTVRKVWPKTYSPRWVIGLYERT